MTTYLHDSHSIGLTITVIPSILAIPLMLVMGAFSDRIGRKRLFVIGVIALAASVFPVFPLLNMRILSIMVLGVTIFRLCNSTQFAAQSAFLAHVFPTEVRCTAISLVYQVSAVIGGQTPPLPGDPDRLQGQSLAPRDDVDRRHSRQRRMRACHALACARGDETPGCRLTIVDDSCPRSGALAEVYFCQIDDRTVLYSFYAAIRIELIGARPSRKYFKPYDPASK